MVGTAVFRIVVSSDSIKNATAISHGSSRLLESAREGCEEGASVGPGGLAFGIIIASLVNVFLGSSTLQWMISIIGVLIFAGLTAWDTQRLKNEYVAGAMQGEVLEKSAIMGALSLYLDFLNLFVLLLQLVGQREE